MASNLAAFEHKLKALGDEFSGAAGHARLMRVANKTKRDVDRAVRADIGDLSMSGWKRSKPIEVRGVVKDYGTDVVIQTSAQGPMRVLESGRNQGNSGGMAGPGQFAKGGGTVRKKNGQVKATRARKAKRWNGYTDAKNTWSDATEIMVREVPRRYQAEVVTTIGKFIQGG